MKVNILTTLLYTIYTADILFIKSAIIFYKEFITRIVSQKEFVLFVVTFGQWKTRFEGRELQEVYKIQFHDLPGFDIRKPQIWLKISNNGKQKTPLVK